MEEQTNNKKTIKQNIVRTTIGLLTLGAIATGTYHGVKMYKHNNFTRVVNESGEYDLENYISYDNLSDYNVVEIETITGENRLFIAGTYAPINQASNIRSCTDIFTGKNIIEGDNTKIINVQQIEDYLVAYNMIKAEYSKEDIETLLEKINEDYQSIKERTLVKK